MPMGWLQSMSHSPLTGIFLIRRYFSTYRFFLSEFVTVP